MVWHVLFFADDRLLVPIVRQDQGTSFMFDVDIEGSCTVKDVRFFRKLADGKVVGFYAVQTPLHYGLPAKLLHEVFRFDRSKSDAIEGPPEFLKVAEERITVRPCQTKSSFADLIKLIRGGRMGA